jgi:spore coat polysaccharide biosynthesis protein SpsF (cytidylyltransferase family)
MPQQDRKPRIGIVVQGRMSSRRLPGKVLMRIGKNTVLQQLVEGCRQVEDVAALCVATSDHPTDDPIAVHCVQLRVDCYRGPLDDVAARFVGAATMHRLDAMVRISADSPLIDPRLIEDLIGRYRRSDDCDLATNVLRRTYPPGMSVEVIRTESLARAHPMMNSTDREHVTPFFYARLERYRIVSVERDRPLIGSKFSVDTPDDFRRISALVERLDRPYWEYRFEQLAEMLAIVQSEAPQ